MLTPSEQRHADFILVTDMLAKCALLPDSDAMRQEARRLIRHAALDFAALCRDED